MAGLYWCCDACRFRSQTHGDLARCRRPDDPAPARRREPVAWLPLNVDDPRWAIWLCPACLADTKTVAERLSQPLSVARLRDLPALLAYAGVEYRVRGAADGGTALLEVLEGGGSAVEVDGIVVRPRCVIGPRALSFAVRSRCAASRRSKTALS